MKEFQTGSTEVLMNEWKRQKHAPNTYWIDLYNSRIFIWIGADLSRRRSNALVCSSFLRPDLFRPAKPKSIWSSDTLNVITMFCNTNTPLSLTVSNRLLSSNSSEMYKANNIINEKMPIYKNKLYMLIPLEE